MKKKVGRPRLNCPHQIRTISVLPEIWQALKIKSVNYKMSISDMLSEILLKDNEVLKNYIDVLEKNAR